MQGSSTTVTWTEQGFVVEKSFEFFNLAQTFEKKSTSSKIQDVETSFFVVQEVLLTVGDILLQV